MQARLERDKLSKGLAGSTTPFGTHFEVRHKSEESEECARRQPIGHVGQASVIAGAPLCIWGKLDLLEEPLGPAKHILFEKKAKCRGNSVVSEADDDLLHIHRRRWVEPSRIQACRLQNAVVSSAWQC
jgi:hypothetical protein